MVCLFGIAVMMLCVSSGWATKLVGTTGSGWILSTLVEIDPATGETLRTIGPVGYIVNGLEYDATTGKLYGSTSVNDPSYNGLIEIDLTTGAGTPIGVHGWDLYDPEWYEAVVNITVDSGGNMYGWWEPGQDDLVFIDKTTGIATRVGESNLGTRTFGLDFDNNDILYMVNDPSWYNPNYYTIDPITGASTYAGHLGETAHHGDFDPVSNFYYGISSAWGPRALVVADLSTGSVINKFDALDDNIHTIAFVKTSLKDLKLNVLDDLWALLYTENDKVDKKIEKAIEHLGKSIDLDYWEDDLHLTKKGKKVFDEEKKAVHELMKAMKETDDEFLLEALSKAIADLVDIDKKLAEIEIQEAFDQGGSLHELEKAQKEMDKADKYIAKGDFDKAIEKYKKAWEHARKALKKIVDDA